MKKSFFLAAAGLLSLVTLAGCGPSEGGEIGELKVWCAEEIVELTTSQLETFKTEHPEWKNLSFKVEAVGEGDAASNMITDPEAGADIYCFAQDQLGRLVAAKAIGSLAEDAKNEITKNNDGGSVKAGTFDNKVYAYPLTSDNGYFMYYKKSVFTGVDMNDLDAIIAKCEEKGANFAFEGGSAWYNAAFFFGAGCVSEWTTEGAKFVSYNDTYNSDKGKVAAEGLRKLVNSPAYVNTSGAPGAFGSGAAVAVSGTWDFAKVKELLGDDMGCTKLPSYTVDGNKIQLGSFSGNKLIGVKPHTDANVATCCKRVALHLTGEKCQAARFEAKAWGPSNKNVQQSPAVKANPGLSALAAQNEFATPQGQFPGAWWDLAGAIGTTLVGKTREDIPTVLAAYAAGLDACLD